MRLSVSVEITLPGNSSSASSKAHRPFKCSLLMLFTWLRTMKICVCVSLAKLLLLGKILRISTCDFSTPGFCQEASHKRSYQQIQFLKLSVGKINPCPRLAKRRTAGLFGQPGIVYLF
jgi:hypothetical protein